MDASGIVIHMPATCTFDIHLCGRCHALFYIVELFMEHKMKWCSLQPGNEKDKFISNSSQDLSTIKLVDPPDKSVIVKNEPIIIRTVMGNNEGTSKRKTEKGCQQSEMISSNAIHQVLKLDAVTQMYDSMQNLSSPQISQTVDHSTGSIETALTAKNVEIGTWKEYRGKKRHLLNCPSEACSYSSFHKKDIERHCRIHTGERPFKCTLCSKNFTRSDKLQVHQRIHLGDKRYKCSECDYASVESGSLLKHQRIHKGERPFKCQLCSYSARDKSQLTVHFRTHTGDSPYVCDQELCKAAFKTHSDLKRHNVVHSGIKPFSCTICPFKASIKSKLVTHMKRKHSEAKDNETVKEFSCSLCLKTVFPTARKLENHMKTKHDQKKAETPRSKAKKDEDRTMRKNFQCKECPAAFVCPENLRVHVIHHVKSKKEQTDSETQLFLEQTNNSSGKDLESNGVVKKDLRLPVLGETSWVPADLDVNLKTAEILASLADGMNKHFADIPAGFFPSDEDLHSSNENIRFLDSALF